MQGPSKRRALRLGRAHTPPDPLKTYVYIDGFNLYYGIYKNKDRTPRWSRYKWLNLERFCDLLLPRNDVAAIRYYTADVKNHGPSERQQRYLLALSSLSRVEIIKGHFVGPSPYHMRECDDTGSPTGNKVWVLRTEEKGSDVNLAVDLLHDCVNGCYECAVVISNDSDLARAVRISRDQYGKAIGIVNPHAHCKPMAKDLKDAKDFDRQITRRIVAASQFPDDLQFSGMTIRKPQQWT